MWSAIAGALGGLVSGGLNAGAQYITSKSLAKYNYELGQRSLENSPSNYKKGLENAGINPILASSSPIGATQGSSGVAPGMDLTDSAAKGNSAKNLNRQTDSNIEYQEKQGEAALEQASAAGAQAEAALINAKANDKRADAEVKGVESTISLNEAKIATEQVLQGKHMSEEMKNKVAALAQWVTSEMSRAELDYWKRHPDQFDDYMEQKLKSEGNINSARDWQKWTNAANTLLSVVGTIMERIPGGKSPSLGVRRGPTSYAPGF